jgi:transcription-repair coupling factor (superfamily II helicase)
MIPEVLRDLEAKEPQKFYGLNSSAIAAQIAEIFTADWSNIGGTGQYVIITPTNSAAEQLVSDLHVFLPHERVLYYPSLEILPYEQLSPPPDQTANRALVLSHLRTGSPLIVVAAVEATMDRVISPQDFAKESLTVSNGDLRSVEELSMLLDELGYRHAELVDEVGQFARRGSIVDVFPPGTEFPVRIELFGDEVESLRQFNPETQRSVLIINDVKILPVIEGLSALGGDEGLRRLRERASELGIGLKRVREIEEALELKIRFPGIELLVPFFIPNLVPFTEYLNSQAKLIVVDRLAVEAAVSDFVEVVAERVDRAREEGILFAEPELVYSYPGPELFASATFQFEPTRFVSTEDLTELTAESNETVEQRDLFPLEKLRHELSSARRGESPLLPLEKNIKSWLRGGFKVAFAIGSSARLNRTLELLRNFGLDGYAWTRPFSELLQAEQSHGSTAVFVLFGDLSAGLGLYKQRLILISEREIFPETKVRVGRTTGRKARKLLAALNRLAEGDYIVHSDHGVGIYRGLRSIAVEGKTGDFLQLEYADGDKLFLPVENISRIQKYAGANAKEPALSKLGTKSWTHTKQKVYENAAELANQLIKISAAREVATVDPFSAFNNADQSFADTFPYDETPDQEKAITEVLADMSRDKPMDRLVCGDVGYGKTEVALRAAFKAASEGKQVAVLVPTTILAEQHFNTFQSRLQPFSFNICCVSRFNEPAENRKILAELTAGRVDIIIGTHRLLQKDIFFKDLGLIIIDEEHRFGVAHKERLKKFQAAVHVLTLTATPIPRTLHMSLSGIKDLSVIETAPTDRQVTKTFVATYSDSLVREAIQRELQRGGQIFYIYNRVQTIENVLSELKELVPEAKIEVGHGQMPKEKLEEVMHRFISGQTDVLLSTTIVESGLDIPNANTIIIRDADKFGLAELYQLRGRVGRSSRRAYSYLLIPDPLKLGPEAKKRIQVLQSLDELGIGFKLALQDMEIRGAGNLLGRNQSGQIDAVGFELYSKILKEAIRTAKKGTIGEPTEDKPITDPDLKIGFPAHIPPWYVPDAVERLLIYQRLSDIGSDEEADEISEELVDRFGKAPPELTSLIELMSFKATLKQVAVTEVTYREGVVSLFFHPRAAPDPERVLAAVGKFGGRLRMTPAHALVLKVDASKVDSPGDLDVEVRGLLRELQKAS